jgi:nucleoside-diphosphate-sugar epimerase
MRVIAIVLVLAVSLVGCTESNGSPAATPPPPRPSSSSAGLGTLPPVPRTLAMDKYLAKACTLLDKADLDVFGFAGQFVVVPGNDPKVPRCEIGGGSGGGALQVQIWPDTQPLQEIYDDRSGTYEFLYAVDLVGMPAVVRAVSARHPGDCEVVVATGKQQGFRLSHRPSLRQGGTIGICGRLATVAETVLTKLGA